MKKLVVAGLVLMIVSSCRNSHQPTTTPNNQNQGTGANMQIKLTSTVFQDNGLIPAKYTCDGDNVSPPLSWSGIPANTKSIALIVDDPDAPAKTWVHWVLFDLPTSTSELLENVKPDASISGGGKHGTNDFNKLGYGGPCPPAGTHRYFFKIYALDVETGLQPGASKDDLLRVIEGHILKQGELMGKYQRRQFGVPGAALVMVAAESCDVVGLM